MISGTLQFLGGMSHGKLKRKENVTEDDRKDLKLMRCKNSNKKIIKGERTENKPKMTYILQINTMNDEYRTSKEKKKGQTNNFFFFFFSSSCPIANLLIGSAYLTHKKMNVAPNVTCWNK